MQKDKLSEPESRFDLDWDDAHVVPPVMFPDLVFLFDRMQEATVAEVRAGKGERVLDVGCGRAIDAAKMAGNDWQCHGLEPSYNMIKYAKEYLSSNGANVLLIRGIGEQLPFRDGTFDKVMCKGALDHFPHPERAIAEMARILKPDGRAIITIANFESLSFRLGKILYRTIQSVRRKPVENDKMVWHVPDDHCVKFDYPTLKSMVEPYFRIERAMGVSLFFAFPWWGLVLYRMPARVSRAILTCLDKFARRMPGWADILLFRCQPRSGV